MRLASVLLLVAASVASFDVLPRLSGNDSVNAHAVKAELVGELLHLSPSDPILSVSGRTFTADSLNVFGGELRPRMNVSANLSSVPFHVGIICFAGIPSEVFEAIVARISVVVTSLHSFWTRADERGQDEAMKELRSPAPDKAELRVSATCNAGSKFLPVLSLIAVESSGDANAPYASVAADAVSFMSFDGSKLDSDLFRERGKSRFSFSHDVTSLKRGSFWSGSAGVTAPVRPAFILADPPKKEEASTPSLKIPVKQSVAFGDPIVLTCETTAKNIYWTLPKGIRIYDVARQRIPEAEKDGTFKTGKVISAWAIEPNEYELKARIGYSTATDDGTLGASCILSVTGARPPPPPVDELTKALQSAYDADTSPTKKDDLGKLQEVMAGCVAAAKAGGKVKATKDLQDGVHSVTELVIPGKLKGVRVQIGGYLAPKLGTASVPVTESFWTLAAAEYGSVAAALGKVVK